MGMIGKAYDLFDDAVMTGVNAGVRAYNWTTGGTKHGLAKGLNIAGWGLFSQSYIDPEKPGWSVMVPVHIGLCCGFDDAIEANRASENSLSEKGLKDIEVEGRKNIAKIVAPLIFSCSSATLAMGFIENDLGNYQRSYSELGASIGLTSISAALYVMRADNLPPRKNCFKRGLENVVEWLDENSSEGVALPEPSVV